MRIFQFESQIWLPKQREEIFGFFSEARNLETITPPWLQFRLLTPQPIRMQQGTVIDYRLRVHGLPIGWRSRIDAWEPPSRFVDSQVRGPYRLWIHEHSFSESNGGTLCKDFVRFSPTGGWLVSKLLVERDVRRIFAYRQERLRLIFGAAVP